MKVVIGNAFSLSMLDRAMQHNQADNPIYNSPRIPRPIDDPVTWLNKWATADAEISSAVGHADTAALFANILGRDIPVNRINVTLNPNTILLVGQYIGPRLPEGTTTLPEGARIEWWTI